MIVSASHAGESLPRAWTRRAVALLAIAVLAMAGALLWYQEELAQHRAIAELPAQERHALYERTLHTLQSACPTSTKPSGLDDFCHEQAEFIVQFPECDPACQNVASRYRGATR